MDQQDYDPERTVAGEWCMEVVEWWIIALLLSVYNKAHRLRGIDLFDCLSYSLLQCREGQWNDIQIEVVSNASSDSDTVFVLYRVNRSVDITANHTPQDTKEDVRTMYNQIQFVTTSVQRVVECLKGEKPSTESFVLEYETKIRELCEASWCLRLMAITCKEPNKGEILVNTLRRNCSVC